MKHHQHKVLIIALKLGGAAVATAAATAAAYKAYAVLNEKAKKKLDEKQLAEMRKCADEMAATLQADWAANRPPSMFTYDRTIAAMVGMRLGIRYEALAPRDIEELNAPKKRSKIPA